MVKKRWDPLPKKSKWRWIVVICFFHSSIFDHVPKRCEKTSSSQLLLIVTKLHDIKIALGFNLTNGAATEYFHDCRLKPFLKHRCMQFTILRSKWPQEKVKDEKDNLTLVMCCCNAIASYQYKMLSICQTTLASYKGALGTLAHFSVK